MSSRAENWAWERDDVKGITKFVLVYLARRAYYDDGAAAWPSVETIAFNCGCCERTVIRSLQELERKGYVFCQIEVVQNGVSIQSEKAAGFSPVERKDPPPLLFGFYPIRAWVRLYDSPSNLIILP